MNDEKDLNNDYTINNSEGVDNMPYKIVRVWVPGYYRTRNGRREHVRGHYKNMKVWVPPFKISKSYKKRR